jgi:hypothetical protein
MSKPHKWQAEPRIQNWIRYRNSKGTKRNKGKSNSKVEIRDKEGEEWHEWAVGKRRVLKEGELTKGKRNTLLWEEEERKSKRMGALERVESVP